MAHAAFDPQLFHPPQKPLHGSRRFDPHQNLTVQSRIELLHFLAFMFDNLLDELSCIRIQHRDRLLSSV
jgi:hypothetical protein